MKLFLKFFFIFLSIHLDSCIFAQDKNNIAKKITTDPSKEIKSIIKEEKENIYRHRDIYFITGKDDSKVQFSLKIKPLLYENFFVGYSQLMFWQLGKSSSPFYDVNYNPEIYYQWSFENKFLKELRAGLEHRSNGEEKELSRSIDKVFLSSLHSFSLLSYQLSLNNRLFYVYDFDRKYNEDIKKYAGIFTTQINFLGINNGSFPSKSEVYLILLSGGKNGEDPSKGSLELGAKYRIRVFGILPHLSLQYYYGYMESMREYNVKHNSFRLGFIF